MTSTISLFKIMQEDMRQKNWMAVLSILGSLLSLPVFFLFNRTNYLYAVTDMDSRGMEMIDTEKLSFLYASFFTRRFWAQGIVLIMGAGIVAILGFRYLYSRKLSDTWHSLPVSRARMFFASYLNGLLIWLIPFLISMIITVAAAFITLGDPSGFGRIAVAAGKSTAAFILAFFMVYHLCLAAVMISGNALNALVTALIWGTGAAGCYLVIYELFTVFVPTFLEAALPIDVFVYLSPLASAIGLLQSLHNGQPWLVQFISSLVAILNLLLAWKLYERRPSELAEHGLRIKWLRIVLHLTGTVFTGLFAALLFSIVTGADQIGWIIFGVILGCVIIFVLLDIIFQMNLRDFLRHKLQLAGITAFTVLIVLSVHQDWFGYGSRLPSADSIVSSSIKVSPYNDNSYPLIYDQPGYTKDPAYGFSSRTYDYGMEYKDMDTLYPLLRVLSGQEARPADVASEYNSAVATVRLELKNGGTFYRNYPVYSCDKELVRPVIENNEYLNTFYPLSMGQIDLPVNIKINDADYTRSYSVSEEDIPKVMDAFSRDFEEHSSLEELDGGMIAAHMEILIGLQTARRYYTLHIYNNYTETLTLLRQLDNSIAYTVDDLDVNSLTLAWSPGRNMEWDAIYSYFGLNGYPDYQDLINMNNNSGLPAAGAADYQEAEAEAIKEGPDSIERKYAVTITDQDKLRELLPILHIGREESNDLFADKSYVYCGDLTAANGKLYSCYVKEGELPKSWIDAMTISE